MIDDKAVKEALRSMRTAQALRWCAPTRESPCGCMGCADGSGGLAALGVTKEQWSRCLKEMVADVTHTVPEDFVTEGERKFRIAFTLPDGTSNCTSWHDDKSFVVSVLEYLRGVYPERNYRLQSAPL